MKTLRIMLLIAVMIVAVTVMQTGSVCALDEPRAYQYKLHNLSVQVENPWEAFPNETIRVNVTAAASAELTINYAAVDLYVFNRSSLRDEQFDCIVCVDEAAPVLLLSGEALSEACFNVTVPEYALNVVYGRLVLQWTESGTEESTTYNRESTFIMLSLKNPELEALRNENADLLGNLTELNNTLMGIKDTYEGELGNTRSVITILAVATVFFVATTLYLFMRKPKDFW